MFLPKQKAVLTVTFLMAGIAMAFGTERKLTGAEIKLALVDKTVAGTDEAGKQWTQMFQKGGVTVYTQDSSSSNGAWEVRGDQYCSQWPPNEAWSCYDITGDSDNVTFISSSGKTWPAKVLP